MDNVLITGCSSGIGRATAVRLQREGFRVFAGVRGPLRPSGEPGEDGDAIGSLLGVGIFSKGVRTATSDERADAHSTAWLFLAMGMAMILVGIAVDPRTKLF